MKRKNDENQENAPRNGGVKEISYDLKLRALKLFSSGYGYRKVSSELGIKLYTARDWGRRFHKGDEEWAIPRTGKPSKRHDVEIRRLALGAYDRGTMSLTEICSMYSIPRKDILVIWIREEKRKRERDQACRDYAGRAVSGEAAKMEGCGKLRSPSLSGAGAGEQGKRTSGRGYPKKNTFLEVRRIAEEKGLTIKEACTVAGCSRSGYYKARKSLGKIISDMELVCLMRGIQHDEDVKQSYGVRRLAAAVNRSLAELGEDATKRDAVKWETEAKASFLNSSSMMFETFLTTKYYPYEEQLIKPTSLISKKRIIDTHLLPYFKDYMVKEITVQDVIEWHSWLMEKEAKGKKGAPLSQSTLSIIHGQLHHIMKHAMRILDINKDVVGLAGTIGSGYTKRESFWSLDEFNAFREEMKSRKYDSQMLVAYDILFWAGLRTAELMGLCVEDCNFENNTIRIERNYLRLNGTDYILTPKTKSSQRTVRIPGTVMAELKDYIERLYELPEDGRIFTFSRDKLIRTMKSAGSAAGISTPATPHSLRHSLATLLLEQGFSLTDIGRRLGHAWYGTTLRYLHAPDKAQDKIAETLNELAESSSF